MFEGSSSVALAYQPTGYTKLMTAGIGGALMPAPGGWLAIAGSTISGTVTNTMLKRKATALAKISEMVAKFGGCVMWVQCGNGAGGVSIAQSVADFQDLILSYQAAGAKVFVCTVPPFTATLDAWALAVNDWIRTSGIPDGFLDTTTLLDQRHTVDGTHLNAAGIGIVGWRAAALMSPRLQSTDGYTGPGTIIWADDFTGTTGNKGSSGALGDLATGWTITKVGGTGTCMLEKTAVGQKIIVTSTTSEPLRFLLERTVAAPVAAGQVTDVLLTARVHPGAADCYWRINDGNGAFYPGNATTYASFEYGAWESEEPLVWRGYSNAAVAAGWASTKFQLYLRAPAGQTASLEIGKLRVLVH